MARVTMKPYRHSDVLHTPPGRAPESPTEKCACTTRILGEPHRGETAPLGGRRKFDRLLRIEAAMQANAAPLGLGSSYLLP
jgi:hypothetical protein